jgi:hypothetical protein
MKTAFQVADLGLSEESGCLCSSLRKAEPFTFEETKLPLTGAHCPQLKAEVGTGATLEDVAPA